MHDNLMTQHRAREERAALSAMPSHDFARAYPSVRYRVRWSNVVLAGVMLIVALTAGFMLVSGVSGGKKTPVRNVSAALPAAGAQVTEPAPDVAADAGAIVAQAREAMNAGNFDEAATLLTQIDTSTDDSLGASELRDENSRRQRRYEALSADAVSAAARGQWSKVRDAAAQVKQIAPLTPELAELQRSALRHLAAGASYEQAQTLFHSGKFERAVTAADTGFRRYREARFSDLAEEAREALAEQQAQAQARAQAEAKAQAAPPQPAPATSKPSSRPPATTAPSGAPPNAAPPADLVHEYRENPVHEYRETS